MSLLFQTNSIINPPNNKLYIGFGKFLCNSREKFTSLEGESPQVFLRAQNSTLN